MQLPEVFSHDKKKKHFKGKKSNNKQQQTNKPTNKQKKFVLTHANLCVDNLNEIKMS